MAERRRIISPNDDANSFLRKACYLDLNLNMTGLDLIGAANLLLEDSLAVHQLTDNTVAGGETGGLSLLGSSEDVVEALVADQTADVSLSTGDSKLTLGGLLVGLSQLLKGDPTDRGDDILRISAVDVDGERAEVNGGLLGGDGSR